MPSTLTPTVPSISRLLLEETVSPLLAVSIAGEVPWFSSVTRTCSGPSTWVSLVGVKVHWAAVFGSQNCLTVAA